MACEQKGMSMSVAMRSIPLVDLRAQLEPLREELLCEIGQVLDSMELLLGPNTRSFEDEFAAYCGVRHGIAVSNGTDALHLALRAAGIGPGDEVVTVPNTFAATVEAIELAGARAILVDIDPATGNLDPARLQSALTPNTRAIIPVHLHGHPADADGIRAVAGERGLRVIEDACQAHGARYKDRPVGSLGDLACYSFYYSKNLGAYGEGGAVVTDDPDLAERVRLLRSHGSPEKYVHTSFGVNARPDEIQSAILRVKLRHLDEWNERRRRIAARYSSALAHVVETPTPAAWATPVFHIYAIRTPNRDRLLDTLRQRGIGAAVHYPIPIHHQPAYRHVRLDPRGLEHAERWCRETLSLPIYPELTDDDVDYVIDAVYQFHR
jgi:dTDP-4-amino-4,6-dideoxygalactose transaminase